MNRLASECLEAFGKIIGIHKTGQMPLKLRMSRVVINAHGGFLDRAVHAFHLL
jgi:hypothetical protein